MTTVTFGCSRGVELPRPLNAAYSHSYSATQPTALGTLSTNATTYNLAESRRAIHSFAVMDPTCIAVEAFNEMITYKTGAREDHRIRHYHNYRHLYVAVVPNCRIVPKVHRPPRGQLSPKPETERKETRDTRETHQSARERERERHQRCSFSIAPVFFSPHATDKMSCKRTWFGG